MRQHILVAFVVNLTIAVATCHGHEAALCRVWAYRFGSLRWAATHASFCSTDVEIDLLRGVVLLLSRLVLGFRSVRRGRELID
jgi:hypothetical protein